jgi:hypothetical protein
MPTPSLALIPSAYKSGKVSSVLPFGGAGDFTFTRAGEKTRINKSQEIEVLATGVPSIDYTGGGCPSLLLEPQQTQLYGETATIATQTKTVTAVEHTVGFYGTGTITFTGTYAGSLVGTGINDRVELTFTPTAGSLISTVSGSVTSGQLVTGAYLGSYIPNTTTGTITRIVDSASGAGDSSTFNDLEGVLFLEISALSNNLTYRSISISGHINLFYSNVSNTLIANNSSGASISHQLTDITSFNKIAFKYKENDFALWINGLEVGTDNSGTTGNSLSFLNFDNSAGGSKWYGNIKQLQYFNTALTDSELTALTTL